MFGDFRLKCVVVTGCASGIGAAVARHLVDLGAVVHGLDRSTSSIGLSQFHQVDLSSPISIDKAVADLPASIDILLNCAGLAPTRPAMEVLSVNLLGTRYLTDRVIARMSSGAAIVSVSSNGGLRWRDDLPLLLQFLDNDDFKAGHQWLEARLDKIQNAYSFAKAALTVWTLQESSRLIRRGIRINCTSPGAVATPMLDEIETRVPAAAIDAVAQPFGRRSRPDEQVAPLLFLASDAASYINGVDLPVDGGFAAGVALRSIA